MCWIELGEVDFYRFSNPTLLYQVANAYTQFHPKIQPRHNWQDELTGDFEEADNARVIRENRWTLVTRQVPLER